MPSITSSQNTPVLPNMRRIVTRPRGANCSRRNSAKLSLATIAYPRFRPDGFNSESTIVRDQRKNGETRQPRRRRLQLACAGVQDKLPLVHDLDVPVIHEAIAEWNFGWASSRTCATC